MPINTTYAQRFAVTAAALLITVACVPVSSPGPPATGALPTRTSGAIAPAPASVPVLDMAALTDYRARIEVRVETDAAEPALLAWTTTDMRVSRSGSAQIIGMIVTDFTLSDSGEVTESVLAGDAVYLRPEGAARWTQIDASSGMLIAPGVLGPDQLAESIRPVLAAATLVGQEALEGVQTAHYALSGDALAQALAAVLPPGGRVAQGQMEFWLTEQGALKQVLQDYIAEDGAGTRLHTSLSLLVTEENQPQDIPVPAPDEVDVFEAPAAPTSEPVSAEPTAPTN